MQLQRPNNNKGIKPILQYIIGCEGINQEKIYFERIETLINNNPKRKYDVKFDIPEPFGGNPRCVVERVRDASIGKINKCAAFDYDNQPKQFEEAIELAEENRILLGYTNYCFDLWLIWHKQDYFAIVSHQKEYARGVKKAFGLSERTDIKDKDVVKTIVNNFTEKDFVQAIYRAHIIEEVNKSRAKNVTPNLQIPYCNNPETKIHNVIESIFKRVGLELKISKVTEEKIKEVTNFIVAEEERVAVEQVQVEVAVTENE